jgi:hypothetical protein
MKTNYKEIFGHTSTLTPLLRYVNTRTLAFAMFVALALLGTMRGNETEKTLPATAQAQNRSRSSEGSLAVYSATDEFNDGGSLRYAHSSYAIYATDGKVVKNVDNHISRDDEIPQIVSLPAGSYTVVARSEKNGYVTVPVVIKAGRRTILDL